MSIPVEPFMPASARVVQFVPSKTYASLTPLSLRMMASLSGSFVKGCAIQVVWKLAKAVSMTLLFSTTWALFAKNNFTILLPLDGQKKTAPPVSLVMSPTTLPNTSIRLVLVTPFGIVTSISEIAPVALFQIFNEVILPPHFQRLATRRLPLESTDVHTPAAPTSRVFLFVPSNDAIFCAVMSLTKTFPSKPTPQRASVAAGRPSVIFQSCVRVCA